MDFKSALSAETKTARDDLIYDELIGHVWEDELTDQMQKGGWPDDAQVTEHRIEEDAETIRVTVVVEFVESVPSSCKDINHEHKGQATYFVSINQSTGEHEIEIDGHADISDGLDDADDDDDWFPGDYS